MDRGESEWWQRMEAHEIIDHILPSIDALTPTEDENVKRAITQVACIVGNNLSLYGFMEGSRLWERLKSTLQEDEPQQCIQLLVKRYAPNQIPDDYIERIIQTVQNISA